MHSKIPLHPFLYNEVSWSFADIFNAIQFYMSSFSVFNVLLLVIIAINWHYIFGDRFNFTTYLQHNIPRLFYSCGNPLIASKLNEFHHKMNPV